MRVPGEEGGRFPLTGRGDVNTYDLFAEHFARLIPPRGRAGIIVPTGIATDISTSIFFHTNLSSGCLFSLQSLENEEFIFPTVHHSFRFCLLTLTGEKIENNSAEFVFFCTKCVRVIRCRKGDLT